jgi:hypothetical protein
MSQPPQPEPRVDWEELRQLLDRELSRLPEKYRVPVVLCELEGRSRREVARQLGLPEGTLSSRLATARQRLARRLSRHGAVVSAGALAAVLTGAASADVPTGLARVTIEGATLLATGQAALTTVASPHVVALTQGVMRAMLLTKVKVASLFILALVFAAGAGLTSYSAILDDPPARRRAEARDDDKPKARDKARARDGDREIIRGSGKEITQELKLADFTSVNVDSVFHVELAQGKAFRVAVTTDDNVMSHIKVTKDGSALKVGLESDRRFENVTLKAVIAMPALEGLNISGASHATVTGFKSEKDCKLRISGAGHLKGDLQAGNVDLEAGGASLVSLKGSAKRARLEANGASHVEMADFVVDKATVTLAGASSAKVQVKGELDYRLSGASHLKYAGDPKIGKKEVSGASSAGKLR